MQAPVAEYLRVDEIAERFHVSIEDVMAACSVLGFPVHDRDGLIELDLFTQALKAVPPRAITEPTARPRRPNAAVLLAAAAAFVAVIAAFGVTRDSSSKNTRARSAASYRAVLKSTYDATVGDAPNPTDYRTLAHDLAAITPPPELRAEHAQLVAEAQTVADLSADTVNSVSDTTATAAEQLREHVEQVETTRVGK